MLLPAGARADELLVMPFACKLIGGRTVLEPGPEVGHRIFGPRETRRFTACSPVNPSLCRNWDVHRFDLDCDGSRTSWVSVVAAAGETNRRARLVDGRLQLRMGPRWALPPDDPCARGPARDDRFTDGRMRRYCADRLAMAPPPVVEMPAGFAPMFGIDGIIVKAAPAPGRGQLPPIVAQPPSDRAARAEPPWPSPFGEVPPSRPEREPVAKEPQARPPPSLVWPEATVEAPSKAEPAPADPKIASRPEPASPPPVTGVPPKTTAPAPEAKPAAKAPATRPPPEARAPPDPKPATKVPDNAPAPAREVAAPPAPKSAPADKSPTAPATSAESDDRAVSLNPFNILRATTTGAIVALAGLVLGLLTAFAVARRRERARHARMRPRDFASASLGGSRAKPKPPARLGYARGRAPPNAAASAMSRVPGASAQRGSLAEWGERMPETRAEALQVLGIGVTPGATETALKKIVDGLRMSWHPDLARDEADRQLRELRSKQINAAWEILQAQRADA
jgi:hypothetical protein